MKFIEIGRTTFAVDAIATLSFHPSVVSERIRPIGIEKLTHGTLIVGLKQGHSVNLSAFQNDYTKAVALLVGS